MKSEFCTVQIGKQVKEYEKGIPYKTIAQEFQKEYDNQIVLVCVQTNISKKTAILKKGLPFIFYYDRGYDRV